MLLGFRVLGLACGFEGFSRHQRSDILPLVRREWKNGSSWGYLGFLERGL